MNSLYIVFTTSTEKCVNHFAASRDLIEHDHNANKRIYLLSCSWWNQSVQPLFDNTLF